MDVSWVELLEYIGENKKQGVSDAFVIALTK